MALPYNDIKERDAQVWNADGRLFYLENSKDLTPFLNTTDWAIHKGIVVNAPPPFYLRVFRQLNGIVRIFGKVRAVNAVPFNTSNLITNVPQSIIPIEVLDQMEQFQVYITPPNDTQLGIGIYSTEGAVAPRLILALPLGETVVQDTIVSINYVLMPKFVVPGS